MRSYQIAHPPRDPHIIDRNTIVGQITQLERHLQDMWDNVPEGYTDPKTPEVRLAFLREYDITILKISKLKKVRDAK